MLRVRHEEIPHNCLVCGKPLKRKKGKERVVKFNKRKTCGGKCRWKLNSQSQRSNHEQLSKECERCGKTFYKKRGKYQSENIARWNERKYCSHKCGTESLRDRAQERSTILKCRWCGKKKERPRALSVAKWADRKFCSQRCSRNVEKFFGENKKRKCKQCGGYIYPSTKRLKNPEEWKKTVYCSKACEKTYKQENLIERPKEKVNKEKPWQGGDDHIKRIAEAYRRKHRGSLPDVVYDPKEVGPEPAPAKHWLHNDSNNSL